MPSGTFQYPRPCGEPRLTHTSTEDPSTPAGGFGSVACGITASFLWVLAHVRFCLCLQDWSICFPQSPWKSYNHIPLTFKARFPGDSQSLCQIPRLGCLFWGLAPLQVLWYYCSPVCGLCTWRMWDLILSWLPPSYHVTEASPLSLNTGYLFQGRGSSILLSIVVQQPVAILVFSQEKMSTCPSTPPSWWTILWTCLWHSVVSDSLWPHGL